MPQDLSRIKSNVAIMVEKGASEKEIDSYIKAEGTDVETIKAYEMPDAKPSNLSATEQERAADISRGQSFNAPERSLLERASDGFSDFVNNFSPTAAVVRGVRSALPATEDFQGSGDNRQEALAQRAAQRVAQEERDAREQIAGRQADDPVYREGQSWYNPEALVRGAADLGGAALGGLVSDPTTLIAPGKSLLEKILGQFVVGGGADLATQGVEVAQDVRDEIDPAQAAIAGATGAALTGVASRFGTPEGDILPKKLREELNKRFDALFETPYSKFEDFEQLAKESGTIPYKPEEAEALKKAIAARDEELNLPDGLSSKDAMNAVDQLSGIRNDAANFRGTSEPKPTDVFPTDASRAADSEAWGQQLLKGKTPSDPISPEGLQHEAQATGENLWKDTTEYEAGFDSSRVKNQPIKDVADYIASDSQHEDLKHIASRLSDKISELQDAGMKFDPVKILNAGERGPASVANGSARGLSLWEMKNGEHSLSVHLRGNDLGGGGENFRTTTHELIHSVTQAAIELGNRRIAQGTPLAKAVGDLLDLQNTITRKFNEDAKAGNFTDFTRGRFNREHNGLSNMHELVAWGLTDRSAQDYLKSIKLNGGQTGFSKFVEVLRKLLGLNSSDDNALSRLISISDDLLKVPGKDIVELGNKLPKSYGGKAEAAQEAGGISKKDADKQFNKAFSAPEKQTTAQWGESLEVQAAKWKANRDAGSTEPAPSPAARNATAEAPTVETPEDLVTRFTSALTNAGKATAEQTALYKAERAKRFAIMAKKYESGEGTRADFLAAKAALAGELPKADFKSIQDQFKPEEVDQLFKVIKDSKVSRDSKFSAENGLERLLNGNLPQPKQLANLAEVFPPDFIKAALSNRKAIKKFGGFVGEIWNIPKSLQSTADFSAPLRQGLGLAHRGEFWKSLGPMVKAAFSPKTSEALEDAIKTHPRYDQAREAGLSLTTTKDGGLKEDMFRSNLAEKIPVWGKVVQGSERAHVGFLNKLRFDTFNSMMEQAKKLGHDLDDPEIAEGISRYINVMTGRGGLGKLESNVEILNNVLYSPGLISSRLQILTAPVTSVAGKGFIADLPAGMRKEALKSYAAIGAVNTTALGLATMAGLTVNLDPRSSDFLKAKDGDTRLDFGGGLTQYTTLAARAFTRERTTSGENGNTVEMKGKGGTPLDNDVQFVMNKMHPTLTLLVDQQRGANTVGEPFEWQKEIIERLTPMGFPDIAETLKEHSGNPGLFYSFLGLVGAGLSNYHSKSDDKNKDQEAEAPDKTR